MKLIKFELKEEKRNLNKRKAIIALAIFIIIVMLIVFSALYITNVSFRNFVDTNIFRKNIDENNTCYIEIESENNPYFFAYDKYVVMLEKNILTKYNSSGKEEGNLKIEISNPIFVANDKFLIIAEKDKKRIYSTLNDSILWEKDLDGDITRISVNKNGYVSVILTGTTYKSVIVVFDKDGKELFRTYLSNTTAVDATISNDNQYMSFAEVDTSGTLIKSTIKTVSIEKAKQSPNEAIVYTYNSEDDTIIINIKYQDKNALIALYNNQIKKIKDNNVDVLKTLDDKDQRATFADIELNNYVYRIIEKSSGLFSSESTVEILNTSNNKENAYLLDSVAKNVFSNEGVIAVNLGTEVYFISASNGWLIKKYSSKQEVKDIVLTDNIAGIIYRDRIELVSL